MRWQSNKTLYRKCIIILVCCMVISSLIEILVFNRHMLGGEMERFAVESDDWTQKEQTVENINAKGEKEEKKSTSVEINLNKRYVAKLKIKYEIKSNSDIKLTYWRDNRQIDTKLGGVSKDKSETTIAINHTVDQININCETGSLKVSDISVENKFQFNVYRYVLFVLLLLSLSIIFFSRELIKSKIEYIFLILCLLIGFAMLLVKPITMNSYDEETHYYYSYKQSFWNGEVRWTESAEKMAYRLVGLVNSIDEREEKNELLQAGNDEEKPVLVEQKSSFIKYTKLGCLQMSIPIFMVRLFGGSFVLQIMAGRLGNLLFYAVIMFLAVKNAKIGKRFLAFLGLTPSMMFMATAFSMDPTVFACITLSVVLMVNEILEPEKKLSYKNTFFAIITLLWGVFPKAIYIPMILLMVFYPRTKFVDKKQMMWFKAGIVIICIVVMSTFVLPTVSDTISQNIKLADIRGGYTSEVGQINYILENPMVTLSMFWDIVTSQAQQFFTGVGTFTSFAFLGNLDKPVYDLFYVTFLFIALTDVNQRGKRQLEFKYKCLMLFGAIGITILIYVSMYLSFTPVGNSGINGVQPRYALPLLYPLLFMLQSSKIVTDFSQRKYNQTIMAIATCILFYGIYKYVLGLECL